MGEAKEILKAYEQLFADGVVPRPKVDLGELVQTRKGFVWRHITGMESEHIFDHDALNACRCAVLMILIDCKLRETHISRAENGETWIEINTMATEKSIIGHGADFDSALIAAARAAGGEGK